MSDPQRLLEIEGGDGDACEAALLRSARIDAPSAGARRRTGVALGIAAGTIATIAAPSSVAAATGSTAGSMLGAKTGATALVLKWVGAGVVSGALAIGAVHYVAPAARQPPASPEITSPPPPSALATPAPKAQRAPTPAPLEVAIEPTEPLALTRDGKSAQAPGHAPATKSHAASPQAPTAPEAEVLANPSPSSRSLHLADEVALLDEARAAVARGKATEALGALDRHDREFPGGPLAPEADVVRIEVLTLLGSDDAALQAATAFLAANPASPQAQHVRSIVNTIRTRHAPLR